MAHDIFISYSAPDKTVADAICAGLEGGNVRCWIAPRDILPGADWGEAIIRAISDAQVMVLVLSAHSNTSAQVRREVQNAVQEGVAVLPFRIEDVKPTLAMRYFLGSQHWLDALTPPLERHVARLREAVKTLLAQRAGDQASTVVAADTGGDRTEGAPTAEGVPEVREEALREVAQAAFSDGRWTPEKMAQLLAEAHKLRVADERARQIAGEVLGCTSPSATAQEAPEETLRRLAEAVWASGSLDGQKMAYLRSEARKLGIPDNQVNQIVFGAMPAASKAGQRAAEGAAVGTNVSESGAAASMEAEVSFAGPEVAQDESAPDGGSAPPCREKVSFNLGLFMGMMQINWATRVNELRAGTKEGLRHDLTNMDQLLNMLELPFPLQGDLPEDFTVFMDAVNSMVVSSPHAAQTSTYYTLGYYYGLFMFYVAALHMNSALDAQARSNAWASIRQTLALAMNNAASMPIPSDLKEEISAKWQMAEPGFDPSAGVALQAEINRFNTRLGDFLDAMGTPKATGNTDQDRAGPYVDSL